MSGLLESNGQKVGAVGDERWTNKSKKETWTELSVMSIEFSEWRYNTRSTGTIYDQAICYCHCFIIALRQHIERWFRWNKKIALQLTYFVACTSTVWWRKWKEDRWFDLGGLRTIVTGGGGEVGVENTELKIQAELLWPNSFRLVKKKPKK